ncbi:hypothetical protein FSP39_023051, partial [Pinctada imbricata]
RNYDRESLTNAYLAATEEKMSVLGAARQFGVPVQTLRDRVKGHIDIDTVKSGKSPVLSEVEEALIVDFLKQMASLGYSYMRTEVLQIATGYAVTAGKRDRNNPFTLRWYAGFIGRWPDLKLVRPKLLELKRAKAGNREIVPAFFGDLSELIKKYDLNDKPYLIFNVKEKGIQQKHTVNCVAGKNASVKEITSLKSSTTTIIGCGSASGVAIPPFFVFAGARMRKELLAGKSAGADGTTSESGLSNSIIFRHYLEHHFLKHVPGRRDDHVLLILDGHNLSHVSVGLEDWARGHNIIIVILPAHTSHFLQPLDVGCYDPFQKIYKDECRKQIIKSKNICEIACNVYSMALSPENLRSAFKRAGIFPLDQTVIEQYLQQS